MIVTVLGSCANQTALREGVALLVEDDLQEMRLLIDAGPGIVAALQRCNRLASDIDNVLLTHAHGDHISGLAYFAWHRFYESMGKSHPAKNLTIYGLENSVTLARQLVEGCYGPSPFPFNITYQSIQSNALLKVGTLSIETCDGDHTTPTISCSVQNDGKKIAFSSDTLPTDAFSSIANNANLLLHEGMWTEAERQLADRAKHSTALDAGKVATKANCKQLALLHIFPAYLGREAEIVREAGQVYKGPVTLPHDGTVYFV